jgi:hypothetical protein
MEEPNDINPDEAAETISEPGGKQLCKSCAALNEPDVNFCVKCGAPLSSYSTIGPFESIFAQGFVYRVAAENPRRFIVVLGIWLIFLPFVLAGAMIIASGEGLGWDLMGLGLLFVPLAIIGRTTWNYFAAKKPAGEKISTQ